MSRVIISWTLALTGLLADPRILVAQDVTAPYDEMAARIWFDRGEEPLLERGEQVRIYYRTTVDAYVSIFNIDTNGTVRLVFPRSPDEGHYVRGGYDYRLLFPGSEYWSVDDHPGMGYFFAVASPQPFEFGDIEYSFYDRGWDLTQIGQSVYTDPYVAMDDYVAALIPDWEYVPYALDFATYQVGSSAHDYPRFLCYECHGFRPYTVWNPYLYECTSYRVVVYTDPWYYPSYRYRGDRVVYTRPPRPGTPRFEFKERVDGDRPDVEYVTRPVVADRPGVPGDPALRRSARDAETVAAPVVGDDAGGGSRSATPRGVPTDLSRLRRDGAATIPSGAPTRPTGVLPGRTDAGGVGGEGRAVPPTSVGARPILERRSGDVRDASGRAEPGTGGVPDVPSDPDPVRSRPGSPSAPSVPARVPSAGSAGSGSGTVTPPAGGSGGRPAPTRPSSLGVPRPRPSSSTPVVRRSGATGPRWVPVLGGDRDSGSTGSAGGDGTRSGAVAPSTPARRGVVVFEGTPESPGYTVTREGGVVVIRGRGPARPSEATAGPEPVRASPAQRPPAEVSAPARPSQRVEPAGGAARTSPLPRTRSGGASVPRQVGRSAPAGRTGGSASPPTVRRSGGGSTPRPSSGGAPSPGGGAVRRR